MKQDNKNSLSGRMKENYENRTRYLLQRRNNVLIRIDGKAFHTYTKGLNKPYDIGLMEDMNLTTKYLCENIQGAKFGYVQSDEISIWITDYDDLQTGAWFDYNIQKMCSISASLATSKFNQLRMVRFAKKNMECTFNPECTFDPAMSSIEIDKFKLATFDSRVFSISEMDEVINYFVWRQQDATRNSISMAAQSMFSHKELRGKNNSEMQDMMMQKGVNWNDYPIGFKRGRAIVRREIISELSMSIRLIKEKKHILVEQQQYDDAATYRQIEKDLTEKLENDKDAQVVRKKWEIVEPPIFTQDRDFIISEKIITSTI